MQLPAPQRYTLLSDDANRRDALHLTLREVPLLPAADLPVRQLLLLLVQNT